MEGRPIVREASLDEYRKKPHFAAEMARRRRASRRCGSSTVRAKATQWGMAIDLNACTGCNACVVACQSENNIPVVGKEQVAAAARCTGSASTATSPARPSSRRSCSSRCPASSARTRPASRSARSRRRCTTHDGLNAMVYNRCIGTRYCSNNCPYKVRRFNFFNYTKDTPELLKMAAQPGRHGARAAA